LIIWTVVCSVGSAAVTSFFCPWFFKFNFLLSQILFPVSFPRLSFIRSTARMQYSLRDRFRGAFLGAALGEILGYTCKVQMANNSVFSWQMMNQWAFKAPTVEPEEGWGKFAIQQANCVIQPFEGKAQSNSFAKDFYEQQDPDHKNRFQADVASTKAGLAIVTLPIALLYHDDIRHLPSRIEQAIADWQQPANLSTGAIVIAYSLALALHEKLDAAAFIPRLFTDLDLGDRDPLLAQQLTQVQIWFNQRVGLSSVAQALTSRFSQNSVATNSLANSLTEASTDPTPIAIALYGFLSTPNHYSLSLLRTARLQYCPQVACCLAGALSGTYNSTTGLPFRWRNQLSPPSVLSKALLGLWSVPSEAALMQQADLLFAEWSGAHDPSLWMQTSPTFVTALPDLIRSRSTLPF
jgi:ADP-ribosylglycohydrolase